MRVYIYNNLGETIGFMDNSIDKSMHYADDKWTLNIKVTAPVFEFKAIKPHADIGALVVGNRLSASVDGVDYMLTIVNTEDFKTYKHVLAYGLCFELINEDVVAYEANEAQTFEQYFQRFVYGGDVTFKFNTNEIKDKSLKLKFENTDTVIARLATLAGNFDAEIEFVDKLDDLRRFLYIEVNVYKEGNLGRDRSDIRLEYSKNIAGITKKEDIREIWTEIRPVGTDGLLVPDGKVEYDEQGNIEYFSKSGYIRASKARDNFPSALNPTGERYILKNWTYETTNADTLYGQALAYLKRNCVPKVEYKIEGASDNLWLGDRVVVVDDSYNPPLYLETRVSELSRSFTRPETSQSIYSNTKEISSKLASQLVIQQGQIQTLQGDTVISVVANYAQSTSGTSPPAGGWSTSLPTLIQGLYLWVRTDTIRQNGSSFSAYSVSYTGMTTNVVQINFKPPATDENIVLRRMGNIVAMEGIFTTNSARADVDEMASEVIPIGYRPVGANVPFVGLGRTNQGTRVVLLIDSLGAIRLQGSWGIEQVAGAVQWFCTE